MSRPDSKGDKFSDAWAKSVKPAKSGKCKQDPCANQSVKCNPCDKQSECKWDLLQLRSAVVGVSSEILLFSTEGNSPGFTGPPSGYTSYFLNGNGVFLKGGIILCPAALVLIPQPVLSNAVRYPLVNPSGPFPTGAQNAQTKVSRILVTVLNANGCGRALVYEASLLGVDGAGNVALLYIDPKKQWNSKCPCLDYCKQPYFRWGDSRKLCPGDKAYLIGSAFSEPQDNLMPSGDDYIVQGYIADNRSVDTTGWNPQELVVVDANVYALAMGLPILDADFSLVALQTTSVIGASQVFGGSSGFTGDGKVSGPSQFWMCPVISALLQGPSRTTPSRVLNVNDASGAYSSYQKAYLGIVWKLFTGLDYDTVYGATNNSYQVPLGLTSGDFQSPSQCDIKVGLRVQSVAGNTTSFYQLPGTSGLSFLPNSPLLNVVQPGDQVLSFNECPIGNLQGQIAPALVTWKAFPGSQIDVVYRKQVEGFTACYSLNVTGATLQPYLDYPWASAVWFSHSTGLSNVFPVGNFKPGI